MRTRSVIIAISALLAALSSCAPTKPKESSVFVRRIIGDENDRYHGLIAASAVPDTQGEILMIGSEEGCRMIAEAFATIDARDNADGSFKPDGIPDFVGETISCIVDTTGRPEKYFKTQNVSPDSSDDLRRYLLNGFLAAMDTVCHVSTDDYEGLGRRKPAKLILFADPILTSLVRHDVDTLFSALGSKVSLVAPFDAISRAMFEGEPHRNMVVSVLYSPFFTGTEEALGRFMSTLLEKGSYGSSVSCFLSHEGSDCLLKDFLDDYIAAGYIRPVHVLAVADFDADIDKLKQEYADLILLKNEGTSGYMKYLADDFRIVNILEATVSLCYDRLRESNCFSHNIGDPQIKYYCHPYSQDSFSNFLVPAQDVQR